MDVENVAAYSGVAALLKMEDEVKFVGLGGGRRIAYREQGYWGIMRPTGVC